MTTGADLDLAGSFGAVALALGFDADPDQVLTRVVDAARRGVGGCDHAAVSVSTARGSLVTVAATDRVPVLIDRLQYAHIEGPGVDALAALSVFVSDDLADEPRWPRFAPQAVSTTGVRSMVSLQVAVAVDTTVGLTLWSRTAHGFDGHARAAGAVLAAHAATAPLGWHDTPGVPRRIAIATGLLTAHGHLAGDRADDALQQAARALVRRPPSAPSSSVGR